MTTEVAPSLQQAAEVAPSSQQVAEVVPSSQQVAEVVPSSQQVAGSFAVPSPRSVNRPAHQTLVSQLSPLLPRWHHKACSPRSMWPNLSDSCLQTKRPDPPILCLGVHLATGAPSVGAICHQFAIPRSLPRPAATIVPFGPMRPHRPILALQQLSGRLGACPLRFCPAFVRI